MTNQTWLLSVFLPSAMNRPRNRAKSGVNSEGRRISRGVLEHLKRPSRGGSRPAAVANLVNQIGQMTLLKRAPRLAQVADTAAFLASDWASGMTGTIVNVTCGMVAR